MNQEHRFGMDSVSYVSGPDTGYQSLIASVRKMGALDVRLIPVSNIIREERVKLKCITGCPSYGASFSCPPYAPLFSEFSKVFAKYESALFIRFPSCVTGEKEVIDNIMKNRFDPDTPKEVQEQTRQFLTGVEKEGKKIHRLMLDLEKQAVMLGYPWALAFIVDSCSLCASCCAGKGVCRFPSLMRYSLEAAGINVIKTAKLAGMPIQFPSPVPPARISIVLLS